ncbi:hypothetical protein INR49_030601 [Caranx melampygus]|nr:hypothetical protein INR49_030601 [Caranx melampygus]
MWSTSVEEEEEVVVISSQLKQQANVEQTSQQLCLHFAPPSQPRTCGKVVQKEWQASCQGKELRVPAGPGQQGGVAKATKRKSNTGQEPPCKKLGVDNTKLQQQQQQ